MIFTARGVEQQTDGSDAVRNFLNILIATGKIGKPNCGYGAITGQGMAREQGNMAKKQINYQGIVPLRMKNIENMWQMYGAWIKKIYREKVYLLTK